MYYNFSALSVTLLKRRFLIPRYLVEGGIVLFLALATVVINWKMICDGLKGMTDLTIHMLWLQHFSKQLSEGIWYPRWLAGTNFGYGSPTFVFYPPLAYYIGSALKLSGLNIEQTMVTLFSLALFISGINFYIYGRNRWGRVASTLGALAYMTAPYIGFDIYFRGGLASMWAQAGTPIGFWLTDQAIQRPKWRVALAFFFALLALTHVPSLLIYIIVWLPYTLYSLVNRSWKDVAATIGFAAIGLGLASFYLFPAILEKSLLNLEFVKEIYGGFKLNLFGSPLPSKPHIIKHLLRMQHIFVHQGLSIILLTVIALFCHYKNTARKKETLCWLLLLMTLSFLMSYPSLPIWVASPTLQTIQFPWRFLAISSFGGAALLGLTVNGIIKKPLPLKVLLSLIIVVIIFFNLRYSYHLSRTLPTLHNPGRGKVASLEKLKLIISEPYTNKLMDVAELKPLLKTGVSTPDPVIGQPPVSVIVGKSEIQLRKWGSYNRIFNVIVEEVSTIRIRTYYYPAWHLYVNNQPYPIDVSDDGTMNLKLKPGSYAVELRYGWTRFFTLGVFISLASIIVLIFCHLKKKL